MVDKEGTSASQVMTVPEAGALLGLGKNASYAAAARGEIPVIRFGRSMRVPKVAFDRMLEQAGAK
jgi:excisionase family DNA binding protein